MSEMVERVARAMCRERGMDPDAMVFPANIAIANAGAGYNLIPDGPYVLPAWQHLIPEARVALRTISYPTEEMVDRAADAFMLANNNTTGMKFSDMVRAGATLALQAGVKAALEGR